MALLITQTRALAIAASVLLGAACLFQSASAEGAGRGERLRDRLQHRRADQGDTLPLSTKISGPGDYRLALQHDGRTREYRVHVPRSYAGATPTALIVALHGGGGDMDYMARDDLYGLITKSEQAGFIIVFPTGVSPLRSGLLATWNAGDCCGRARDEHIDDVGYIRDVILRMQSLANIDRKKVFAIGMSNGGMMAYRLACEASDLLRGVMSVAGTDNTRACAPSRAVAVLHIHARNDDHVLFTGGAGDTFRNRAQVTDFVSVPDTIEKWARLDHAQPTTTRVLTVPGAYCDLHTARPDTDSAPVELCVTDVGGHSWPGGAKPRGEAPSQAIRANDVMWDFFSSL